MDDLLCMLVLLKASELVLMNRMNTYMYVCTYGAMEDIYMEILIVEWVNITKYVYYYTIASRPGGQYFLIPSQFSSVRRPQGKIGDEARVIVGGREG